MKVKKEIENGRVLSTGSCTCLQNVIVIRKPWTQGVGFAVRCNETEYCKKAIVGSGTLCAGSTGAQDSTEC